MIPNKISLNLFLIKDAVQLKTCISSPFPTTNKRVQLRSALKHCSSLTQRIFTFFFFLNRYCEGQERFHSYKLHTSISLPPHALFVRRKAHANGLSQRHDDISMLVLIFHHAQAIHKLTLMVTLIALFMLPLYSHPCFVIPPF